MKFTKVNTMCLWERIAAENRATLSSTEREAMRELERKFAPSEDQYGAIFEYEKLKAEILERNWKMRQERERECDKAERRDRCQLVLNSVKQ